MTDFNVNAPPGARVDQESMLPSTEYKMNDSEKYKVNPMAEPSGRHRGPYANTTTHRNDRITNDEHVHGRSHTAEPEKKHGAGAHNWSTGRMSQDEPRTAAETMVPAEKHLRPETDNQEKGELDAAYKPDKEDAKLKTLDEYEAEGHRV